MKTHIQSSHEKSHITLTNKQGVIYTGWSDFRHESSHSTHSSSLVWCTFNASHMQKRFACCRRKKSDDFKTSTWWTHTSPKLEKRETNQLPLSFEKVEDETEAGGTKETVSKNGTYWRWILREEQRNRNHTREETRFLLFHIYFVSRLVGIPHEQIAKNRRIAALWSEQKEFTPYEHVQNKHQLLHSWSNIPQPTHPAQTDLFLLEESWNRWHLL